MSKAKIQFDESIKDAEELLAHFDAINGKTAPRRDTEVLKRSAVILALTAWETYVEDRAREAVEAQLAGIKGSPVANFVAQRYGEEMKRFHTPNAEKTRKLFCDYTGKDVTAGWSFWGFNPAETQRRLDELVKLRGKAAHRSPTTGKTTTPHLLSRGDLETAINLLKALVDATEKGMQDL